MGQEAFFFNLVAYTIILVSIFVVLGIVVLYFRDGIQQEPRFGVALKFLGLAFILGLLFFGANALLPWVPFYILGVTFAGTPAVIILFIAGGFLLEATKFDSAIVIAVLGGFGGIFLGVFLLVMRHFLERV